MSVRWLLENLGRDVRFAARLFVKSPGYTAVALLSLALGIGANTAIFSVVYGVLIDPYPYAKPNEIWAPEIRSLKTTQNRGSYHFDEFVEAAKLPAFAEAMATSFDNILLTGDRAPESLQGIRLSESAFHFMGVPALIGRTLTPSDIKPTGEAEPVLVLSYGAWQRLFDGNPDAIGKTLRLNDVPHTVVGVMPSRFGWYTNTGIWLPLPATQRDRWVNPIFRLWPGVSKQVAEQQLHALHLTLAKQTPANFPKDGFRTILTNYMDITVASGEMRSSLQLLFGVVGFLLLIACANVANLQLAHGTGRAREIAVRMSIGAGRGQVLRQLLTESVVLSLAGGALGVLFAVAATKAIVALMPDFYVPNEARITVNTLVLLFSAAVSMLTGILFGLAPALHCSRPDLTDALKDAGRGSGAGRATGRTRNLLVIAEVALSVILLIGASLTIRSFVALHQVDSGLRTEGVLFVGVPLLPQRYSSIEQRDRFAQSLIDRVKTLPGVEAVGSGTGGIPFGWRSGFAIPGKSGPDNQRLALGLVSADYLRTIGVPLLRGRALAEQEIARAEHVALINETMSKLWPAGESPLGQRLRIDFLEKPPGPQVLFAANPTPYVTIVGIVADTKNNGLKEATMPGAFVPYTLAAPPQRMFAVRTQGDPKLLLNAVRAQVQAIDKDQPLGRPLTLKEILGFDTVQPRFNTALFSFFALLGLTLAMAGIYSVLSYHAARRTHEIGVRMALGAERGDVLKLLLGMGSRLIFAGIAAGLLGSLFLARFLQKLLFHVQPTDPVSMLAVVALLSATALLACYVPARRAARVDPITALRHE
jgi:putative ABC transport system permease protein